MDLTAFVEGLAAGYGIAIPVGAISLLIVNTALQCGFRIGFMAGAGAATADCLYATVAAFTGVAIAGLLQPMAMPLRVGSGSVLVVLAVIWLRQGLRQRRGTGEGSESCPPLRMYARFLGLTIINPMTVVYFTALILGRSSGATPAHAPFIAGVALSSLSWQGFLAGVGGFARRRLDARFQSAAVVAGNLLIAGLGLRTVAVALLERP